MYFVMLFSFQFANKEAVVQDIILHDSISKRASAFFQLSSGLSTLGFLDLVKCFPNTFEKYFVHNKSDVLTPEMIKEALLFPSESCEAESRVIAMLHKFIDSSTSSGS